jgi:hypothetical protein
VSCGCERQVSIGCERQVSGAISSLLADEQRVVEFVQAALGVAEREVRRARYGELR